MCYKRRLKSACVFGLATLALADRSTHAQPRAPSQTIGAVADLGTASNSATTVPETITVRAQRRLLKEKNSPSAVTELGSKQIAATGVSGSVFSVLRQAPSVNLYQQGIGDNAPELTIRGVRGLEIAATIDGVPTQDLEAPGANFLQNNIGSFFTLDQISGVSIYPGVAYPNKNTFGTIGGTIAYDSKRPSADPYGEVFGELGSFQTWKSGFALNSGSLDGPLGTGENAPKVLLQYSNLQTAGYIDDTSARYNSFEFAADKPYDDGASKLQATVLYNTGAGYQENEPVPLPYLQRNGLFSNYPTSTAQNFQRNDFLTVIVKDDTYINDYLSVGLSAFYLHNDHSADSYGDINVFQPGGQPSFATVGVASPFIDNPAGFGLGGSFGPPAVNSSGYNYLPGKYTYNPLASYPVGSRYCPAALAAKFAAAGQTIPCGLNSELQVGESSTYGVQPRATIVVPEFDGIANTIQVGGLIAKESSPTTRNYLGATPEVAQAAGNLDTAVPVGPLLAFDGGTQRTIYEGYAQDKIDLFGNTLHVTPGFTLEGTYSDLKTSSIFNELVTNLVTGGQGEYVTYKQKKWDRDWLPFLNVTYDLDHVLPRLKGLSIYGSTAQSALFAPVTDFTPNGTGAAPGASIVHLYEGGVKYNTPRLLFSLDYYYQKVDRDFGFLSLPSGPQQGQTDYNGNGQREFKGIEGAVTWQVSPSLQLFGNGSHTLAKYLKTNFAFNTVAEDQYGVGIKGTPITGVPDWLATFGADYSRKDTIRDGDAFDVRVTGLYTGHQSTSTDLTGFGSFPSFPGLASDPIARFGQLSGSTVYDPNGGIAPFFVTNLDVNYTLPTPFLPALKRLKFDLNIQNLFDQHYFQYFYKQISPAACGLIPPGHGVLSGTPAGPYGCTPEFADGIPGQPFGVFFSVSARF